jgi:hypothetical protein
MSKTNTEISTKELENRELLYCLYYDIMDEIKGEKIKINKEEYNQNILNTEIPTIINFVKEAFSILLNKKIEESKNNIKEKSKDMNLSENINYESRLKYLESQIRFYIKRQLQYKIQKESFENKIKNYMNIEAEYEEMKQKLKYEDGKFMNNDRKDNEIEILRRENSNLKKAILKIEKENILIESKRIEEKKLIENLKEQNEKYKKLIKKLEQSQKDISTNSSINININNNNNQGSNLIINKNIETNNSNSSNSKKQIYNNKNYKTNIIDNYAFTSAYNKILNSISNKTPKKIPKHRKTNSMNMNIDDNKKNDIISKYFTNQKICNSSIKQYKNYAKISGGSYNKPISNRKNNQISFVSKIYNKDKKLNKSINRSTLNKRPCSKDYY